MTEKVKTNGKMGVLALVMAILGYLGGTVLPGIGGNTTNVARLEERIINLQEDVSEVKQLIYTLHPPKE
jgi:hypothetical protein